MAERVDLREYPPALEPMFSELKAVRDMQKSGKKREDELKVEIGKLIQPYRDVHGDKLGINGWTVHYSPRLTRTIDAQMLLDSNVSPETIRKCTRVTESTQMRVDPPKEGDAA